MKKWICVLMVLCLCGCMFQYEVSEQYIDTSQNTLETRIKVPASYTRIEVDNNSLGSYLRQYPLYPNGSPVLLYNGEKKVNQGAHVAVFQLPLPDTDLQQCADSVIRVYADYFYESQQYDRISFHFVSGFKADYSRWREGYRIVVDGNDVTWQKTSQDHTTKESYQDYLNMVFAYASTLSLSYESQAIDVSQAQIGDIFLKSGSPGHVVMIVDVCMNNEGKKAFLLAQGYMPAQQFHVIKNPKHKEDMWYYEDEISYPFYTAEYTFSQESLRHLEY